MSTEVIPLGDAEETRACPFCGEEIKAIARKCRHCHEMLGDLGAPGVFRQGKKIVVSRNVPLPPRCVKTGEPTDQFLMREVRWHSQILYLLLLTGILPYLIVALLMQKRHRLRVPLTRERIVRRRLWLAAGWLGILGGIGLFVCAAVFSKPNNDLGLYLVLAGLAAILLGAIVAIAVSNPLTATYIDNERVWLKGAGRQYLADLPEWQGV